MKQSGKCPKCGSQNILEDLRVLYRNQNSLARDLEVPFFEKPQAFIFKGKTTYTPAAWVCTACGYTELYCTAPE
jgi:predicted nucleic-acid-binding Zn-ribbon protein